MYAIFMESRYQTVPRPDSWQLGYVFLNFSYSCVRICHSCARKPLRYFAGSSLKPSDAFEVNLKKPSLCHRFVETVFLIFQPISACFAKSLGTRGSFSTLKMFITGIQPNGNRVIGLEGEFHLQKFLISFPNRLYRF